MDHHDDETHQAGDPPTVHPPRTPAALAALLAGDEKNFAVAQVPGGIEMQEKVAQEQLVEGGQLPADALAHRAGLESAGFIFRGMADDLFVACRFPPGWTLTPTAHSMWSEMRDECGRLRMRVFYKGAFYDRRASTHLLTRLSLAEWYAPTPGEAEREVDYRDEAWRAAPMCCVVRDHDGSVLFASASGTLGEAAEAKRQVRDWLDTHFPLWQDPFVYWSQEAPITGG